MRTFLLLAFLALAAQTLQAQDFPRIDLTRPDPAGAWRATHDVSAVESTPQGLLIRISGVDPYITGPRHDYPAGKLLWMTMRLRSEQAGTLQVFYFNDGPREENSVRIPIRAGVWEEVKAPIPALGAGYHLRIDPPGGAGACLISSIAFEERKLITPPAWPQPAKPTLGADALRLTSGDVTLAHSPSEFSAFIVSSGGQEMAIGWNRALVGYLAGGEAQWLELSKGKSSITLANGQITSQLTVPDAQGATWTLIRRYAPGKVAGTIEVEAEVACDQEREVIFAPLFGLLPGVGSFGVSKAQAVLPGVEYLDKDEPSSSEADLAGQQAQRLVPDRLKITFPLAAVAGQGRYIALAWERKPEVATVFDSPDRQFKSGGHLLGLIAPGSDGSNRLEGNLLPYWPVRRPAGEPLRVHASILSGAGQSIVPAVKHYLTLHPLPQPPEAGNLESYVKLTAAGWLDSKIRDGSRFRHAIGGNFGSGAAADAAILMDWLAGQTADATLSGLLKETSAAALAQVPPAAYNSAAVGHVRYPAEALVYGHVPENLEAARGHARALLQQFQPDGTLLYRPGKVNYAKTHFAPDANGLTANSIVFILEAAALTGDEQLTADGLRLLKALNKFDNTVPRGAQTWEMPLHTPDILASAHLVRAYLLGYQLTGDKELLDRARYWGMTGIPCLYLDNPIADAKPNATALPYAVIAVFGATNWQAPNWIGLPVQWCGLVYSDALYRLAQVDDTFPWRQVADGITASGIQQSVPMTGPAEQRGLLPDSFQLRPGIRNGPFINPATVQANAIQLYRRPPLYQFVAARQTGLLIHAPGAITDVRETDQTVTFQFAPALARRCTILISHCPSQPAIQVNGKAAEVQYVPEGRYALLAMTGGGTVKIQAGPVR